MVGAAGTLLQELLPRPPALPVVRFSELPYLLPLAELAEPAVPHVVVDQVGADLLAVDQRGEVVTADIGVRRAAPGAQGARRRLVASVDAASGRGDRGTQSADGGRRGRPLSRVVGGRAVVVAGEVQARSGLLAELPMAVKSIADEVAAGGRATSADFAEHRANEAIPLAAIAVGADLHIDEL